MTDTTDLIPGMREITIQIPTAVAQKMAEGYEGTLEEATIAGLKLIHGMGMPSYTKLQEIAKRMDTSVPKALRAAVDSLGDQLEKLRPGTLGRPKVNEARDELIYNNVTNGSKYADVAAMFGVSLVRVGQIVAQQRAVRGIDRSKETLTRNAEIVARVEGGESRLGVAASYGVTRSVVDTVMSAHRAANPKTAPKPVQVAAPEPEPESFKVKSPDVAAEEPAPKKLFLPGLMKRHPDDKPAEVVEDTRTAVERNVFDPEFGF